MNRIYKVFLVRDWDKKNSEFFPIPLCKAHGKELKRGLKIRKPYEFGVGFYVLDGEETPVDCFFCKHPEEETLKKLIAIQEKFRRD